MSPVEYARVQRATTQAQRTVHAGIKRGSGGGVATVLPTAGHLLDRELTGQGVFAHGLHSIGGAVAGSPLRFAIAPLTVPNILGLIPGIGEYPGKLARNTTRDLFDLPANVIPSLYVPGKKAASGDVGGAAKLFAQPFEDLAKHPGKSFSEHPLNTALMLYGAKGGLGRGIGAAGRRTGVKGARVTSRPSRTLAGTTLTERREYSPDVFAKAHQVARDRRKTKKAAAKRDQAVQARQQGHDERALSLERQAQAIDPLSIRPRDVQRRVDERVDANWQLSSGRRSQVQRQVKQTGISKHGAAGALVAQGIAKATPEDLMAYSRELEAQFPHLDAAGKVANRQLRKAIKKTVKSGVDRGRVEAAAEGYRKVVEPLEQELVGAGLLDRAQADRAKLIPYAVRNMGARFDPVSQRVTLNGRQLPDGRIRAHMREAGVPEPAFVTQAPNMRGARNFFKSSEEPQRYSTARRTGEATRAGTFDVHPDVLGEQAVRMQQAAEAQRGFTGMIGEFSRRGKSGKPQTFQTYRQGAKARDNLHAQDGSVKWRLVRLNPFGGKQAQLEALLENATPEEHAGVLKAMDDALAGEESAGGPWALIPEVAAERLREHLKVLGPGGGGKALGAFNKVFRQAVLMTPKWLTGNTAEATVRTGLNRATPLDLVRFTRTMKTLEKIDPRAAEEAGVRAIGGGHLGMTAKMPRRSADQFENTRLEGVARALGTLRRTPGPKQLADAWEATTHLVFDRINRPLENQFQKAMAGRYIRTRLMDPNAIKNSKRAIEDAAKGLTGTEAQVAMGRYVDRAYGSYSKFSPSARRALALYTPFAAWTLNAFKFILDVLPRDHPVATAVLASANTATEEWRKDKGLAKFMGEGQLPGFLQGTIPTPGGGHLPVARYTPFGAFGDPFGTVAGAVLPQGSGVLANLKGYDWKGQPLKGGENEDVRAKAAAWTVLQETVPFLGLGSRVAQQGTRALNPAAPYPPSKKDRRKKKGSGPSLPALPALPPLPPLPPVGG